MGTRQKPSHHNLTGTDIYRVYRGIKFRCTNKKDYHAKYYVNKGITMCEEWLNNPKAFCDWAIANGYKKGLTIDRIDNNKGYYPENCRWVNMKVQSNNRNNNRLITINGITKTLAQWSEESGIGKHTILRNIKKGYENENILTPEKFHMHFSKIAQYNLDGTLIKIWNSPIEIKKAYNFASSTPIISVCKKKPYCHTAFGYGWAYYPEDTWKPAKKAKKPEKQRKIGKYSYTYSEWSKKLNINIDYFRHIWYEIKDDENKQLEFLKKYNLK